MQRWGPILGMLFMLLLAVRPAAADDCNAQPVCVHHEQVDGRVQVVAENRTGAIISIRFFTEGENVAVAETQPYLTELAPQESRAVFMLSPADARAPWQYATYFEWQYGTTQADGEDSQPDVAYALPYTRGETYLVVQGYHGRFSHQETYALDFDMPVGTPVRAARAGIVTEVEFNYRAGGLDEEFKQRANYVRIAHDDGTIAEYLHLDAQGVRVHVGQEVAMGQLIGYSGNTGYTSGPHLHFEVYRLDDDLQRVTVPTAFYLGREGYGILRDGQHFRAP